MNLGFVGLGLMGAPMTQNLIKAGHKVRVWNRTPGKATALSGTGAIQAESPMDVAGGAEVTIVMVTDSPDVEEVVLGDKGIIEGAQPESVVIDMSSISPSVTRKIAARLQERQVNMLDAPVSGGVWGAQNASLSIMVGGQREIYDRCLPIFDALGQRSTYCGGTGMGQVAKLVNQVIVAGTLAAVAEGLAFAAKSGVDLTAVFNAVTGGAANSWQLENLGARILKRDFAPGFKVRMQAKDLRLIQEAALEMQLPLLTTPLIHQGYVAINREGLGEEGTQAYVKLLERLGGVEVSS
jgi:3-hydroxyisobutyrate dehydrogenase-like beta-hydroxyacid dehydrogenase